MLSILASNVSSLTFKQTFHLLRLPSSALKYFYKKCPSPCLYLFNANTIKRHQIKKQSPHAPHPEPTGGCRPMQGHCAASGLCDTLQTQPSLCSLTFPLICRSSQSNAIINKDHKQVMAFIPLKFMVQKRSFCGRKHWLLFCGSFSHSPATRHKNHSGIVVTKLNVQQRFSVLDQWRKNKCTV